MRDPLPFRRKLNARIVELEELAEQARLRASKLEKEKNKLIIELREISVELESVSIATQFLHFNIVAIAHLSRQMTRFKSFTK